MGAGLSVPTSSLVGFVPFATVSFLVLAAQSSVVSVIQATAGLADDHSATILRDNSTALAADMRDGWNAVGQLSIAVPGLAGIYVAGAAPTLIAVSGLQQFASDALAVSGTFATSRITAFPDTAVQPASCSAAGAQLAVASSVTGCLVTASGAASAVSVTASLGGLSTTVSYRVYSALSINAIATRTNLRRLGSDFETTFFSVCAPLLGRRHCFFLTI